MREGRVSCKIWRLCEQRGTAAAHGQETRRSMPVSQIPFLTISAPHLCFLAPRSFLPTNAPRPKGGTGT